MKDRVRIKARLTKVPRYSKDKLREGEERITIQDRNRARSQLTIMRVREEMRAFTSSKSAGERDAGTLDRRKSASDGSQW
jgi:hypothetical protein